MVFWLKKDGLAVRAVNINGVATGTQDLPGNLLDTQIPGPEAEAGPRKLHFGHA